MLLLRSNSYLNIGSRQVLALTFALLLSIASLCSCMAAAGANNAEGDQPVYTDSFVSGWINYGWAKIDAGNPSPVHAGKASLKIASNAFDGLHIHHSPLDSRLYRSLTFWINGGPTGGQHVRIGAYLSGELHLNFITLAPLPAETWQRITISLASLGVANKPDFTGILIGNADGTDRAAYYVDDIQLVASPPPATMRIDVDARIVRQKADDCLFGVNAGAWDADLTNHVPLLQEIDNRALRFPGGTLSDTYHWATDTSTDLNGESQSWPLNFDSFAAAARRSQAQVFITVNYGSGTPQEAADWVRYSNVIHGFGFQYWEIGNECNLGAEPDKNNRPHEPFTYAMRARDYITQMKAADPTIQVGVVIGGNEDSQDNGYHDHPATNPRTGKTHNGWDAVVLATLKTLGVTPDFVIYHRYVYLGGQEHDTSLLLSSRAWTAEIANIRQMLSDYLGAAAAKVEIMVTEHNSTASAPGKQTTSLVNGLFLADSIGYAAQTEIKALLWWQLSDERLEGNNDPSLYGWRQYGGYGIMARAAVSDPKFEVYPTFYIYKLLKHFARGGDDIVQADSNYPLLSAHAAKRRDGSLSLLVINKNPASAYEAKIFLNGYAPKRTATVYSYGIPQDNAARTKTGSPDIARTVMGTAGVSFAYKFPPYSATIISLSRARSQKPTPTAGRQAHARQERR